MSLLDILFPKFCINCRTFGSYVCSNCFVYMTFAETGFCTVCQKPAIGGLTHPKCRGDSALEGVFSSLVYQGMVKKLIYQFKYPPHVTHLQALLIDFFSEGLIQQEQCYRVLQSAECLIPIPLHATKLRKRGYNQAKLLADGLGKRFGIPVIDCLIRVKNTKTQVGLTQKERLENSKDAFSIKKVFVNEQYNNVLLVDDVVTTGATLQEASKVLKKAGVQQVWGITLAHGQ